MESKLELSQAIILSKPLYIHTLPSNMMRRIFFPVISVLLLRVEASNALAGTGFGTQARKTTPSYTPDQSPTTQALAEFLNSQMSQGIGDKTQIGYSDSGMRGMYAARPFKKGEILCQIPSDCALALSDPSLGGSDAPTLAHGGRNFLVMYEKDPQAKQMWTPYLNTLPTRDSLFDPTPDFYSPQDLEQLEFPRIVQQAQERQARIREVARGEEAFSEDELRFATWLVSSRCFSIQITAGDDGDAAPSTDEMGRTIAKPQKNIRVLLPYLDMINHSSNQANAELHLIDPEKDEAWFAIRATRKIPAGKEVTISYGSGVDSSVELLLKYGFVPSENKFDSFMLKKGGDDTIGDLGGWSTTLEEDMAAFATAEGVMRTILAFRIKLKQAY